MKTHLPIREIANLLNHVTREDKLIDELRNDERKGVKKLLERWQKQQNENDRLLKLFEGMSKHERLLKQAGKTVIAGVDEVGRGSIAGPVVAAAVILPDDPIIGLKDSKQLTLKKRIELYEQIKKQSVFGIGVATVKEIDLYNIYHASKLAMNRAVHACRISIDHLLVDAMTLNLPIPQTSLIKGDQISVSIAAASIVAKVTRDRMMMKLSKLYPQYGFDKHVGYGTKEHVNALKQFGVTNEHRRSFSPVSEAITT